MFHFDAKLTDIISKYRVPEHPDLGFTYHIPLQVTLTASFLCHQNPNIVNFQPGDTVWVALKKGCSELNSANVADIDLESHGLWKRGTVIERGNLRPMQVVPPMACENGEPVSSV